MRALYCAKIQGVPERQSCVRRRGQRETMPHKLLLVEDDELSRDMLSRRLKLEDYDVVEAADGLEAVDLAHAQMPDLILMDINLPKLDGWQAIRRLKGHEATCSIPVIVLTAHAMKGDEQRSFEAGCDAFETKPVEWARLTSTIKKLLNKKGSADGICFPAGRG
jgi:two-component system, cell cycle response regulator DivK